MSGSNLKVPPPLSAQDKSSFAYKTIKDRLPVIIVKTIDFLHRHRKDLHTFGGTLKEINDEESVQIEADAKEAITRLAALRKDLETNKSLQLLENLSELGDGLEYFNQDVEDWNQALNNHKLDAESMPRYFDSPWLLVECYLYRCIKNIMLNTRHLKMFDPFVEQKQAACKASLAPMLILSNHLRELDRSSAEKCLPSERTEFGLFLQMALWANKSDLSISGMSADKIQSQSLSVNIRDSLDALQENILCDNTSEVWFKVQSIKQLVQDRLKRQASNSEQSTVEEPILIDLVADNAGYEIFVDLLLIHFLGLMFTTGSSVQQTGNVLKFRIHLKRMPWFVSDCLRADLDWLLNFMSNSKEGALTHVASQWESYIKSGFWEIHDDKFWTLPHDYSQMQSISPGLHAKLTKSSLIIFKGDLNYRKLTGDRRWHILTPFRVALRGFEPAPLVALRTAKADVVVGIEDVNIYAKINNNELPRDWMISGDFGLIQYVDPL